MEKFNSNEEFLSWLTSSSKQSAKRNFEQKYYHAERKPVILTGLDILNIEIHDRHFESIEFRNCTFDNCEFSSSVFFSCELKDCRFVDCKFNSCKFLESDLVKTPFEACFVYDLELADINFSPTLFINCGEIYDLKIRSSFHGRTISFINCYLHFLDIEPSRQERVDEFTFDECLIHESSFDRLNLTKSIFTNCNLSLNQFSACELNTKTLENNNVTPGDEYNLVDIRTIINSEPLSLAILEKIFGIYNSDVKDYLIGLTNKITFQSIFISYSFKDSAFAKIINAELMKRGILTFLWEKDSPGGKALKKIMSEGVRNKDRILFIASTNSLKSKACQFELTEGRRKQELIWEDVLFPIHIDNYLFDIEKETIRPRELQEEYWNNIEELKTLNSLDFSQFLTEEERRSNEFEKLLMRLVKGLRKEK